MDYTKEMHPVGIGRGPGMFPSSSVICGVNSGFVNFAYFRPC